MKRLGLALLLVLVVLYVATYLWASQALPALLRN